MSVSERPQNAAEGEPEEDKARETAGRMPGDGHELPLFLRGGSDGRKGNAQDEKDEIGE
jgi:hypothetical protein